MTHVLWLPEESSVVEIMPPNYHYTGFRNLSKMKNLQYFTIKGMNISDTGETYDDWMAREKGQAPSETMYTDAASKLAKRELAVGRMAVFDV
jgi:hypothetical protein